MNRSELQEQLRRLDLAPSRKLGQSFLVDEELARWIVEQLRPVPDDVVIEVGAGFGALTDHLAGRVRRLVVIEADGRLAGFLQRRYEGSSGVEVVHDDAARWDVRPLFREGGVKLIGNLPYSCGNEILRRFLDAPSPVTEAVVMVQKEVADRFVAEPCTKAYGVLSLMLGERWRPEVSKTAPPAGFHPCPEVDSSIVRFEPRPVNDLPLHCGEVYAEMVKRGFSQRRKQLHNNLAVEREEWAAACEALSLSPGVRAEELTPTQWVELSNYLAPHPCSELPPSSTEALDVVDENDVAVDTRPRREIHEKGWRHRAVHVFLFNRCGELYLQKRSHLKDTHPGKWDSSASGHVDPGESYAACAEREMWEELWVRPKGEVRRIARVPASEATDWEFIEVFAAIPSGCIRVHGAEVEAGQWFSLEEIDRWIEVRPRDFATGFVTCFGAWRWRDGEGVGG